jgi:hypothetical protein
VPRGWGRSSANRFPNTVCSALKTSDGTLCSFSANYEKLYRIGYPSTFAAYLKELDSRLSNFDLPLGANIDILEYGRVNLQV